MDTLLHDLRYSFRSLLSRPAFTLAALVTLALGIGATTAIFSVVQSVLLRPLPFEAPERLVVIGQANRTTTTEEQVGSLSYSNFIDLRDQTRSVEALAVFARATATVTGLGDAESVPGAAVSLDFFRVLGATPYMGRTFTAEEDAPGGPRAIILSYEYWRDRLGSVPDVLERSLDINGNAWRIAGVMRPGFEYPSGARIYFPSRTEGCGRGCVYLSGLGRLAPGATLATARAELETIAARLEQQYPDTNAQITARAVLLTDYLVGDVRTALLVMLGAVFMVLLIACANVANLLLVRGAGRSAELAVRSVLGAGRGRLVAQLMTENVVLSLAGGIIGILLAVWGVDLLRAFAPGNLPRLDEIAVDATTMLFALLLVMFTTLAFGLAPALRMSRAGIAAALRGTGRGDLGVRQGWGRSAILAAEVGLALVLLMGAGLMTRTLVGINRVDTGMSSADVAHFTVNLPEVRYPEAEQHLLFHAELRERLSALPGVDRVGLVMPMPLSPSVLATSFNRTDVPIEGPRQPVALMRVADSNGLAALGISLVSGRYFEDSDREGAPRVALINRTAAEQYWPGEDPIGRQIEIGVSFEYEEDQPRTIVGVVEDIRALSLTEPVEAEVIVPFAQSVPGNATIVLAGAEPAQLIAAARRELRAMDAALPLVRPGTLAELVEFQTGSTRFFLLLLGVFAILAVVLAAVGIYGVVAYVMAGRVREIGVRVALGARTSEVVGLVLWQGVRPALVGVAAGLLVAAAASRVLAGLLFGIAPHDPLTFAAATLLLLAVVVIACIVPAGRASRIPPASALRAE